MSASPLHGSCLCQRVSFEVAPPFELMVHCHCARCRKATGTGHATNLSLDPAQFRWLTGEELISRFDLPDTRNFSKWFCSHCGSPLPRLSRNGQRMILPAGGFDSPLPNHPTAHIFWDSRANWDDHDEGLPIHAAEYPGLAANPLKDQNSSS